MRFNPIKLLHGLLYTAPVILLTLAACGGSGGGGTTTTPVVAPSTAPTVSPPVAGCKAINLNWTAVTGATGYNVYGAASGVTATQLTATPVATTSYTDAGLIANTTYNYQVTAVNSAGEGPKSATATATTKNPCTVMGGSIQGNNLSLTLTKLVSILAGQVGAPGSTDGTGIGAQFNSPTGVTTDGTNLYVADTTSNIIRKIVISTGAVTTVAGSAIAPAGNADNTTGTSATFKGPAGITTDGVNLYVTDGANNTIRQITIGGSWPVTTVAGSAIAPAGYTDNTTGISARFTRPQGITTDGFNLYVADTNNHTIRQIVMSGLWPVSTLAGSAPTQGSTDATGTAARFSFPAGITTDGTNLYTADTGNQTIRKIQ